MLGGDGQGALSVVLLCGIGVSLAAGLLAQWWAAARAGTSISGTIVCLLVVNLIGIAYPEFVLMIVNGVATWEFVRIAREGRGNKSRDEGDSGRPDTRR